MTPGLTGNPKLDRVSYNRIIDGWIPILHVMRLIADQQLPLERLQAQYDKLVSERSVLAARKLAVEDDDDSLEDPAMYEAQM